MKVYIETYGCSMNRSDSETIAGLLRRAGHEIVGEREAELIIVNTCVVKKPTEDRIRMRLKQLELGRKKVLIAGCMPKVIDLSREFKGFSIIGPDCIGEVYEVIEEIKKGRRVIKLEGERRFDLPKIRENPVREIIPIAVGCVGECSYCCVRFARGKLRSCPEKQVVKRIRESLREGVKEIWLTGQDTGAYGKDIGSSLVELLERILSLRSKFWVRIGMMNPNHAKEMLDELLCAYESEKVFKFLHLPLQSGSDRILKLMNRFYQVKDFEEVALSFRKKFPMLALATDLICGFPTESEGDHALSEGAIMKVEPDVVNISKFFPRPLTKAARMKMLSSEVIKERSKRLGELCRRIALKRNKRWIGWRGRVLIDERGKGKSWIGRNFAYKPIVLKGEHELGEEVEVEIVNAYPTWLEGKEI